MTEISTPPPQTSEDQVLQLHSPGPAAAWSILLTPIFGAAIVCSNWKAIGNQQAQRRSFYWAIGLCIPYTLLYFTEWLGTIDLYLEIGLLLAWYLIECRAQTKYIRAQKLQYERREWLDPMSKALPIGLATFIISVTLTWFAWTPVLVTGSDAAYLKSSQKVLRYMDEKYLDPMRKKERNGTLTEDDLKIVQAIQHLAQLLENSNAEIIEGYYWTTQELLDYAHSQLEGGRQ